ncbi:hypothetical protein CDQ92_07805 [Sphingopyxis bauzanensis]|uniref:Uncharacterized protein n=1 Tax=Sphingopyxis bauzanensis TaxID=651663 RepID=A0A246JV91_9SPHN|nr:hypothetical protein [Sphingopyxis bauzanensis]OWQ96990.1 hypothetical protein CDQ92_07805 [Sphingopyxis bauzanensis]
MQRGGAAWSNGDVPTVIAAFFPNLGCKLRRADRTARPAGNYRTAACSGERAACREFHLGAGERDSLREHAALAGFSVLAGIIRDHPVARQDMVLEIVPRGSSAGR